MEKVLVNLVVRTVADNDSGIYHVVKIVVPDNPVMIVGRIVSIGAFGVYPPMYAVIKFVVFNGDVAGVI
jgi:hypothetical protein